MTSLTVLAIILVQGVAAGASFNCFKAETGVEKSICDSKVLSGLDEQLAKVYGSVILLSDDPDRIKSQQQNWLRNVRDRCKAETCLKGAYENRLSQLSAMKLVEWKTFRDKHLGIEFSYPGNRKVKIGCHGSRNCVALTGKPMPGSDYLIAFEMFDGDLEAVAADKAVFGKKTGGWVAKGRFAEHPVIPLSGVGWQGIKSVVDCGISDDNGFHAGAGECLWVVLSNGKRSVIIDTQGIVGIDEASVRSIQSIRFSK